MVLSIFWDEVHRDEVTFFPVGMKCHTKMKCRWYEVSGTPFYIIYNIYVGDNMLVTDLLHYLRG